ncbi:amino acid permease [Terrabacter aerolatus]|uniref:Transporter n=1 Tax=Terrabacter aerolatus TaxID=422442 RepID=A0A512D241_9MICO|nr:APC family permease [Terrabacter aerolatus]GEO30537.1 transporter [Terrabacter aerolatus]
MSSPRAQPALARRLTTRDAAFIGVGSMVGAGLFTAFAPAAAAAGSWMLASLGIAAVIAFCNATSSAQLAAQYPTSGGTYVYGRERLGPWWGFVAGWGFVIGKTAGCAAMALAVSVYVAPPAWQRPLAAAVVVALVTVNYRGITRTAALTRVLVTVVLLLLALVLAVSASQLWGRPALDGGTPLPGAGGWDGVLRGGALLFFAFAGYARVATLGEDVLDPARAIPRAIVMSFAVVVPLYAVTAVLLLHVLGPGATASTGAPLHQLAVMVQGPGGWLAWVVSAAAAVAALGALLALVAGVGRTTLAMAREGDLPRVLAAVHPRFHVPHRAELALGAVVVGLVLVTDLRGVIGFSSFGVLTYYAVANAAALTQHAPHRRYPRALATLGLVGCVLLALAVLVGSLVSGAAVLATGVLGRFVVVRRRAATP